MKNENQKLVPQAARQNNLRDLSAFCELLGTLLFTYIVIVSDANSIADSLSLFALLLIFGGVTGGHFNPATTIGVFIYEGQLSEHFSHVLTLFFAQISGALIGVGFGALTIGKYMNGQWTIDESLVPTIAPKTKDNIEWFSLEEGSSVIVQDLQMYTVQIICTFIFIAVNLAVLTKLPQHHQNIAIQALTVALTLVGMVSVANNSASQFNPAVTIGLSVLQYSVLADQSLYLMHFLPAYFFGPLIGGILAGLVMSNLRLSEEIRISKNNQRSNIRKHLEILSPDSDENQPLISYLQPTSPTTAASSFQSVIAV